MVFPPLVLAGIIVFLANPVVTRLHRRGLPRVLGAAVTYLGFFLGVGLLGLLLSPLLANQFDQLSERLPEIRKDVEDQIDKYAERSSEEQEDWFIKIPSVKEIEDQTSGDDQDLGDQVTTVRHAVVRVFHVGLILILGPDRRLLPADGPARRPTALRGADPRGVEAPGAVPRAPAEPDHRRVLPRPARWSRSSSAAWCRPGCSRSGCRCGSSSG